MRSKRIEKLLRELEHYDRAARFSATHKLGRMRAEEAIEPLLRIMEKDEKRAVRWMAAWALGCMSREEAIPTLVEMKNKARKGETRKDAAEALKNIGGKIGHTTLKTLIREEEEKLKRIAIEQSVKEREATFRGIIKRYQSIPLKKLSSLLRFRDTAELEAWLLHLPDELAFRVEGEQLIIPQELQSDTAEAEEAITALLKSFEEFEKKGEGKV